MTPATAVAYGLLLLALLLGVYWLGRRHGTTDARQDTHGLIRQVETDYARIGQAELLAAQDKGFKAGYMLGRISVPWPPLDQADAPQPLDVGQEIHGVPSVWN